MKMKQFLRQDKITRLQKLEQDTVMKLYAELKNQFESAVQPGTRQLEAVMEEYMKNYMEGIMRMNEGKPLYPDANFTLRVSYGREEGYHPCDRITYLYS